MTQGIKAQQSESIAAADAPAPAPRVIGIYQTQRVDKVDNNASGTGADWYRYVISNGASMITGQRCGTREQVLDHANGFAAQLNDRALGVARSTYASRKKPQPTAPKTG